MINKLSISLLAIAATVFAGAQTSVTLKGETDTSNTINIYDAELSSPSWINVYASPENASVTNNGVTTNQVLFCGDLGHYSVENTPTPATLKFTDQMGANYQLAAQYYNHFEPSIAGNAMDEAALQLTIWDAIYGQQQFSGNSALQSLAAQYYSTDVSAASNRAAYYDFGGQNQNMIGSAQAVPEPCSIIALGTGAVGLFFRKRK